MRNRSGASIDIKTATDAVLDQEIARVKGMLEVTDYTPNRKSLSVRLRRLEKERAARAED